MSMSMWMSIYINNSPITSHHLSSPLLSSPHLSSPTSTPESQRKKTPLLHNPLSLSLSNKKKKTSPYRTLPTYPVSKQKLHLTSSSLPPTSKSGKPTHRYKYKYNNNNNYLPQTYLFTYLLKSPSIAQHSTAQHSTATRFFSFLFFSFL